MKFSVLLSVYAKEHPMLLDAALHSIWQEQVLKPTELILVQDGLLTKKLYQVISVWQVKLGSKLTVVSLATNVGLAAALNEGLKYCKYDLVARMDTDDIATPERFYKQVMFMDEHTDVAVSSGLIEEWNQDLSKVISSRRLPLLHEEILRFSKLRSPISHPAVIFRKTAVLEVGGYPAIYPEDYPLWGLMLHKGYRFANLPDLLLKMRVGNALVERRGKEFLKGEIRVFRYLHQIGFLNTYELYRNIFQRTVVRLSPVPFKKFLYKFAR